MTRRPGPLWLAAPTRFATLSAPRARIVAAAIAFFLVLCLSALRVAGPPPVSHDPANRAEDQADVVLYESIVDGVRHGGNYYQVTADALRAGNYPLRPFVTFRLPTLAVVQARVPPLAAAVLLYALALAAALAWYRRLKPAFPRRPPLIVALALLAAGMIAHVQAELVTFHEVWAGLLVALSLALRTRERWVEAAALGCAAMLIRETAALYVGVMAALALLQGRAREALGWAAGAVVLAVAVAFHARAVAEVVRPLDPASPGWAGLLGLGFFVKTMTISTALVLAPAALAAVLVGMALVGWAAWRGELAMRAAVTLAAYAALLAVAGRPDTFYWGLLVAPILLVGLAAVPDALADLVRAALDTRRITVTRLSR